MNRRESARRHRKQCSAFRYCVEFCSGGLSIYAFAAETIERLIRGRVCFGLRAESSRPD